MYQEDWISHIEKLIVSLGYEVVDIKREVRSKLDIIKIFIDTNKGVTLNDCSKVSRYVNDEIFKYDLVKKDFRLEVSSPGIDRPLTSKRDFERNISKKVRVIFSDSGQTNTVEGRIVEVNSKDLVIEGDQSTINVQLSSIVEGKVVLPW